MRTLKLIATSGVLIGLGYGFAPYAMGAAVGLTLLGAVMAGSALREAQP